MFKRFTAVLTAFVLVQLAVSLSPVHANLTVTAISTAKYPVGLDSDSNGNIFIVSEENTVSGKIGLIVIPDTSGTLFGQSVTANQENLLVANNSMRGVAVNSSNDVFYSLSDGKVYALTSAAKTLFGVSVAANTPTLIKQGSAFGGGLQFDSAGNLFGITITSNQVGVIPVSDGTLFGTAVTANTPAVIASNSGGWFWDFAIDDLGNVIVSDGWGNEGVWILPKTTGTQYGQAVTANTFTRLTGFNSTFGKAAGIDADTSGNLFVARYGDAAYVYSRSGGNFFGQTVTAATLTRLTATGTNQRVNQGLAVTGDGDLITGGGSATYLINYSAPAPTQTPTPTQNTQSPTPEASNSNPQEAVSAATQMVTAATTQISTGKFKFGKGQSFLSSTNSKILLQSLGEYKGASKITISASAGYLNGVSKKKVERLALKRANSIKALLVKNGIDASKITIELNVVKFGVAPKSNLLYTL